MKKGITKILSACVFAFVVFLVAGTQSKAATNMGLKQTNAGSGSVDLEWNAQLGADHYHVQFSQDGKTWTDMGYSSSPDEYIYNLSTNTNYYARVVAYKDSHYSGSHEVMAISETAIVGTKAANVTGLTQTAAGTNSVSMAWNTYPGASAYIVYGYINYNWTQVATVSTNSATITGVAATTSTKFSVVAVKNVTGGTVIGERSGGVEMKTVPIKVSRIAMQYYWDVLKEAKYIWTDVNNADGYQYEVKSANGKKTYFRATSTNSSTYVKPFPRGIFVKARVRAYVTVGNKVYYGAWSPYTYHASSKKVTAKRSSNGKKISLKWKKVSGACGYQVYVSTKSNGGFKKVKSLSSKKSSYTITKCGKKKLKKGKTYYVQLRYQTKVGKKKVSSKIVNSATVY